MNEIQVPPSSPWSGPTGPISPPPGLVQPPTPGFSLQTPGLQHRSFLYCSEAGEYTQLNISGQKGNSVFYLSPGLGWRWRIIMGYLSLVNDGTVATRNQVIGLCDSAGFTSALAPALYGVNAAASETKTLNFGESLVTSGGSFGSASAAFAIGRGWIIEGADQLFIRVSNGVAGDIWSARIRLLQIRV